MRRNAHRLLSGFPMVGATVLGLLAASNPAGAKIRLDGFIELMSDNRFFWLCMALLTAYAALWWLTSIEPVSQRERLKASLRPFYADTGDSISSLKTVETDEQLELLLEAIDIEQQEIVDWLSKHMGQAAVRKFLTVHGECYVYSSVGTHVPALKHKRDDYLNALHGRLLNLQQLLELDRWGGPRIGQVENWKRRAMQWRTETRRRI